MPRAHLTLTVPDGIWVGDVSRAYPDARFRIVAALADGRSGVGLAEITARRLASLLADIEASEGVTELEILRRHDTTALVQFETTTPLLLFSAQRAGIPLELPFVLTDGTAEWELTVSRDRLSELGAQLDRFGVPFTVDAIYQRVEPEPLLTERQRQLLIIAAEAGYYDTRRECSLTELADALGIAKSTCSETLHRAEGKVIKRYLADVAETAVEPETA